MLLTLVDGTAHMSSDGVGMDARCVQLSLATTAPLDPDEEMRRAVWTVKADAESVLAAEGGCTKLLHCVRHGQGLHNVDKRPIWLRPHDAQLTPEGVLQCKRLSDSLQSLKVELIVCSPLTRTLQTATLCFAQQHARGVPIVPLESLRETVNYLCDARRNKAQLESEFPTVSWADGEVAEVDPLWEQYEKVYGSAVEYTEERECKHLPSLSARLASAFAWILARPEREIALVSHMGFFFHSARFGTDRADLEEFGIAPVTDFAGDRLSAHMMRRPFANCECRSVVAKFPE